MLFNSLDYAVFLIFTLLFYWLLALKPALRIPRLLFVLFASCIFYMAWNPWYIFLILFSTTVDWFVARKIALHEEGPQRKRWLFVSLILNLTLLGTFKYFDFLGHVFADGASLFGLVIEPPSLAKVFNRLRALFGWDPIREVILPVGISFYTFESLSYCIDVYRKKCEPARTPLELLLFITFFPKLVAGPIARPAELFPQVRKEPYLDKEQIGKALHLIVTGLIKKVAFADYVSINLVDRVFDAPDQYTAPEVVVALYGFTLQIYMDFSGYTDIARGSAKLFGIELPENFDRPYQASNPAEFWRRWHMTLSTWLRDYLYFPLGGSKLGEARTYFNLWITIFLIGLWHGANWTFVIYGAIQASFVVIHRIFVQVSKKKNTPPSQDPAWLRVLKVLGTLQLVVFSRILFRANDLGEAKAVFFRIFSGTSGLANVAPTVWVALLLGFALHYTPRSWYSWSERSFVKLPGVVQGALLFVIFAILNRIASSETVPYVYFQF
ncbi:MAG: MBOAT family protein [Sandaracinaceae bacterium]|nr:MBOAT family protein [Sandaracinaceae bacterium]MDW8246540.1 MBOAT family O-acyltransferase [Sandaracinaceae bacterium]